jgi:hypothetical protein
MYKLNEQQEFKGNISDMASKVAEYLFRNKLDVYRFTNQVEECYEMLVSDNSTKNVGDNLNNVTATEEENVDLNNVEATEKEKQLIDAIRNSSHCYEGEDVCGHYDESVEMKQAELKKPFFSKYAEDIGYHIWRNNTVSFYIYYSKDSDISDCDERRVEISDSQIPQIISLIKR